MICLRDNFYLLWIFSSLILVTDQKVRSESKQWNKRWDDEAGTGFHILTLTSMGDLWVQVSHSCQLIVHICTCLFSSNKSASSLTNGPGWLTTRMTNTLSSSMIMFTSRSTSTRLPWEECPRQIMPPSVTPSEGSSTSEGLGGIQTLATPSNGSSMSVSTQ